MGGTAASPLHDGIGPLLALGTRRDAAYGHAPETGVFPADPLRPAADAARQVWRSSFLLAIMGR